MTKRIAVVVGASGEIGREITRHLVEQGLFVIGVGRSSVSLDQLEKRFTGEFLGCATDIQNDDAIQDIRGHLSGEVAIAVMSAGVPVAGGVQVVPTTAIHEAVNIKVAGFLRLVRAVEPKLVRHSRLVAVGGHYGFEPSPYAATAGVANAALANIVRQVNWWLGPQGITSHLIAPGPADTDRLRRVLEDRAALRQSSIEDQMHEMRRESAIHALTEPRQIAWAVRTLLAPEADALAGSALMMDAGRRRGIP